MALKEILGLRCLVKWASDSFFNIKGYELLFFVIFIRASGFVTSRLSPLKTYSLNRQRVSFSKETNGT